MHKHPLNANADVSCGVRGSVFFHTLCKREAKTMARLQGFASSSDHCLLADVTYAKISCTGPYKQYLVRFLNCIQQKEQTVIEKSKPLVAIYCLHGR